MNDFATQVAALIRRIKQVTADSGKDELQARLRAITELVDLYTGASPDIPMVLV